jgi:hypothetical protein
MRKYEEPSIQIVMTDDDIITLSNGGIGSGSGEDYTTGNSTNGGDTNLTGINF